MNRFSETIMRTWIGLGTRFLPFADVATRELPLSRLLRLSLFQVSVGMATVLLVGTLNRVMIVELGVPASLVAVMIALPLLFAPFRALIGFKSDTHHSALGWKRVPFIWKGTLIQFGGLAIMPFALLVLSGGGQSAQAPVWVGQVAAALAFLLVGAGLHTIQTAGLALATDLVAPESQPNVVGLMYVMLLLGTLLSALLFGTLLEAFSPGRLVQVIQGAAVCTVALNIAALWKQETRRPPRGAAAAEHPSFAAAWRAYIDGDRAVRHLVAVGLGTMAFSMQDVLLEPYGGAVLNLTVSATTRLTATLAFGGLVGFGLASRLLSRGGNAFVMTGTGALLGIPAFAGVIVAAPMMSPPLFGAAVLLIGFAAGLFSHGTLTAAMGLAPTEQRGLALGAWGAVQASAAGLAVALGGVLRDVVSGLAARGGLAGGMGQGPATGYIAVYILEMLLLLATLVVLLPLVRRGRMSAATTGGPVSV